MIAIFVVGLRLSHPMPHHKLSRIQHPFRDDVFLEHHAHRAFAIAIDHARGQKPAVIHEAKGNVGLRL